MLGMARLNGRTRYASPSSRQLIASRQLQLVSPVWDGKTRFGSDGKRGEYQVSYAHGTLPWHDTFELIICFHGVRTCFVGDSLFSKRVG